MSESSDVAVTTILTTLIIVDIIGNSLVIFVIKRNRDMRTPLDYLIGNLAISDIILAVFTAPIHILNKTFTHPEGAAGSTLCKLLTIGNFAGVGAASSSFTLVAIAVERYSMVMLPPGSKWKLTKQKVTARLFGIPLLVKGFPWVIISGCWIFAVAFIIPPFLATTFDESIVRCNWDWPERWMGPAYNIATWLVLLSVVPLIAMTCLYFRVVRRLWFKRTDRNELSFQQKGVLKVRKRVTLTVITVSAIFGVCWITGSLIYTLSFYDIFMFGPASIAVADTLLMFNSAVNPFVYSLLNERFRKKVKASLCCSCATREPPSTETDNIELQHISRDPHQRRVNEVPPLH